MTTEFQKSYNGFRHLPANSKLSLGQKPPYFSLRGTDGKIYSLANLGGGKALVILFLSNHCPKCQSYEDKLVSISETFKPHGVKFAAICSNDADSYPEDSFEKMVEKSKLLGFPFPYLQDDTQAVAKSFDAACTPEVFIFDKDLFLQYHGAIEDESSRNLAAGLVPALESILGGGLPIEPLTPCLGCSIKWKVAPSEPSLTWS